MDNGRVVLGNEIYNKGSLFTNDDLILKKNDNSVNSIYEENPLQNHFFCKKNINTLQRLIKENVYTLSNKRHIIADQDETSLKIIMKSIYLQFSKNLKNDISNQINDLKPDAVYVIGQPNIMFEIWTWVLQHKYNLYIEKPMGLSLHQAKILKFLALENDVITQVSHQRRSVPMLMMLKQKLEEKGRIIHGCVEFFKCEVSGHNSDAMNIGKIAGEKLLKLAGLKFKKI